MSTSKDLDFSTTSLKDTCSQGNEVYINNFQLTPSPESSMDRRSTILFTFKSGTRNGSKEFKTTLCQYQKFTFLMTSTKPKHVLKEILQRSQTEVAL